MIAPSRGEPGAIRWAILAAIVAAVVYLCFAILRPFFDVIAWSSLLAIAFYPIHRRLTDRIGHPTLSALLSSALVLVTILIPLLFIAAVAVQEFVQLKTSLDERFKDGFDPGAFEPLREAAATILGRLGIDPKDLSQTIARYAGAAARAGVEYSFDFATGITGAIVERHPFGGFRMSGAGTKAGGRGYLENFLFPRAIAENVLRRGFTPPTAGE